MRRVVQILIWFYPANWRERYGEEFEALLEDTPPGWAGIFDLLKGAIKMQFSVPSFPGLALMLSVAGLVAGLAISFAVTPRFFSTAAMTLSSTSSNVSPSPGEYLMQLENEILSRTSLSSTIQYPGLDLYKSERARIPLEDIIEEMRKNILIRPEASGSSYLAFRITFGYADRIKAQQTVQRLIARLIETNLRRQEARAYVKGVNRSDQIDRMEARIAALEERLGMPSKPYEPDFPSIPAGGFVCQLLDPPSLPVQPVYPDRVRFMAAGFGAGMVAAVVIAVFRRRVPPIPFPAQTV